MIYKSLIASFVLLISSNVMASLNIREYLAAYQGTKNLMDPASCINPDLSDWSVILEKKRRLKRGQPGPDIIDDKEMACDWTSTVNEALSEGNLAIHFPEGKYFLRDVNLSKSGISLTGEGASTQIRCTDRYEVQVVGEDEEEDVKVSIHFDEDCTIFNTYYENWKTREPLEMIKNLEIRNIQFKGPEGYRKGTAIRLQGVSDARISNLWQSNFDKFIQYDNFRASTISEISNGSVSDTYSSNYVIYSNGTAINNDIVLDKIIARAHITNISLQHEDDEPGNEKNPASIPVAGTINDGITISNSVLYHSGKYNVYLYHPSNVNIYGNQFFGGNSTLVYIFEANNAIVNNNILINDAHGDDISGINFEHNQNFRRFGNVQVSNNFIRDMTAHGIRVGNYRGVHIFGNTLKNVCTGPHERDGIHLHGVSHAKVSNNFIYAGGDPTGLLELNCRQEIRVEGDSEDVTITP